MNAKEEPTWRVVGSYFLILAAHIAVWILALCSFVGIPYWLAYHWDEVSSYVCGESCGRGGNAVLVICAALATSIGTSLVLCGGILLGVIFKERMKYIQKRVEEFVAKQEDEPSE